MYVSWNNTLNLNFSFENTVYRLKGNYCCDVFLSVAQEFRICELKIYEFDCKLFIWLHIQITETILKLLLLLFLRKGK